VSDVIVIGAGLAGLTAALTAARRGHRVRILERLPRAGGLCGAFEWEGRRYIRACNEFGGGVADVCRELGVDVPFCRTTLRLLLPTRAITLPPGPRDLLTLVRRAPGFLAAFGRARGALTLDDVLPPTADPFVRDLGAAICATSGTPPNRVPLSDLAAFLTGDQGWLRPVKVEGGPQVLTDALVHAVHAAGVGLDLSVDVRAVHRAGARFVVQHAGGELTADAVFTSAPRLAPYPPDAVQALYYGVALFAFDGELDLDARATTLIVLPPDPYEVMLTIDAGTLPPTPPFILARQVEPLAPTGRTVVAFFPMPRGRMTLTDPERDAVHAALIAAADRAVPGFAARLCATRLLTPVDFHAEHGLPARALDLVPPPRFTKPTSLDPETGLWHVGTSVGVAGADAATAMFVGRGVGSEL
jgi:phytoene dehydrogenase-like protein